MKVGLIDVDGHNFPNIPLPMIYDKAHADPIYKKLQRWCSNYVFWSVPTFDEYLKGA